MVEKRYIAFGDIHGMYDEFMQLWNSIDIQETDTLVFLGDYIDRGPKSKEVLDFLMNLPVNNEAIFLRGNHEDMMLKRLVYPKMAYCWIMNGGVEAMNSFGTEKIDTIPKKYDNWIENKTVLYYQPENTNILFVHAGINPNFPIDEQSESEVLWIREEFINYQGDFGVKVIHGHTPSMRGIDIRHNRINVDTGSCFGGHISAVIINGNGDVLGQHSIKCNKLSKKI